MDETMKNTNPSIKPTKAVTPGFSMVEFLIAAFIMAIGILGLTTLLMINIRQSATSRSRSTATYIAQSVLQQAQIEGQHSYFAKINNFTPTLTPVFTTSPGTAINETIIGGFNIDGIRITNPDGTMISNIGTIVQDANKRSPIYTTTWARRAYNNNKAPIGQSHSQEFVVNVQWTEENQIKFLSMSRLIRY